MIPSRSEFYSGGSSVACLIGLVGCPPSSDRLFFRFMKLRKEAPIQVRQNAKTPTQRKATYICPYRSQASFKKPLSSTMAPMTRRSMRTVLTASALKVLLVLGQFASRTSFFGLPPPLWARCIRVRTIQGSGRAGFVVVVARWTQHPNPPTNTPRATLASGAPEVASFSPYVPFLGTCIRVRTIQGSGRAGFVARWTHSPSTHTHTHTPLRQPTPCSRRPVAT